MNPYLTFVQSIQAGISSARGSRVFGVTPVLESVDKVLIFSPHPDDECITGLLPLRLMREGNRQIINVPVTFGSDVKRRAGRAQELSEACAYLGWKITGGKADLSALEVDDVVAILAAIEPEYIFMPHSNDWNSRHIATHFLVVAALEKMDSSFSSTVVETEFWRAMDDPNLMVEGDAQLVADLVAATSLHTEEVARNPYHLLLPAWMQDSVRRGGELVCGQGGTVPNFSFTTLYRLRSWANGAFVDVIDGGKVLPMGIEYLEEIIQ